MTPPDDQERISKLRALIDAEGDAPRVSAPAARDGDPSGAPNRSPLFLAIGGGAVLAVVVALLVLGGDSGVKQPEGTTSRRVSVFPTRITGGIDNATNSFDPRLGSERIEDSLNDFVSGWKDGRRRIIEAVEGLMGSCQGSVDAYLENERRIIKSTGKGA